MESRSCSSKLSIVCALVLLHGAVAFSCCVAAEFVKLKAKDVKMDGSQCSLRRSPAFGLGVAALVCLSIAQFVGTSAGGATASCLCRRVPCSPAAAAAAAAAALEKLPEHRRSQIASTFLLTLSWVGYGSAAVLLGTASSMNHGQPYGQGWMDGHCYVVKDGVYAGAATLVAAVVAALVIMTRMSPPLTQHKTRGPDEEGRRPEDLANGSSKSSC